MHDALVIVGARSFQMRAAAAQKTWSLTVIFNLVGRYDKNIIAYLFGTHCIICQETC